MKQIFTPATHKKRLPAEQIDSKFTALRWQSFVGIFLGYAGYYLVRNNFSLATPDLIKQGYSKADLGYAFSAVAIAYGISKFIMGNVSDRSNARLFLSIGLVLSACTMIFMGLVPWATSSVVIMFILLFINGWFSGMGWPPCGRVVVHWFSVKERGRVMSVWNLAHNTGGALMPQVVALGFLLFATWQSRLYFPGLVALGFALIAYLLVRDTPQSCGLPPVEEHKNDYPKNYTEEQEKELSAKDIFFKYIFNNRLLWYAAFANVFVYMIRKGVQDWSPIYLTQIKHFSRDQIGWSYTWFEIAGIPGTLLCGWISDKVFKGRRAPATIIYMLLIMVAVVGYWQSPSGNVWMTNASLISIGFLIYGPVMLIGVQALDLVPKKAAGTAAGLTGLFGYLLGAVLANALLGVVIQHISWSASFYLLIAACFLSIFFTALTWNREKANLLTR
ncbi:glycerol-3-phosphate transporter [Mucilaginibacter boryungensis]|uniref:Glycerol-3-phosphate transporter n=1 Tax=Mucilaginibacter boryungensis TaxID=768480 RepID=A0ABR9XFX1_9SPHI|nr:glycerol-3-phosphate transporter [Mucilaginibacter boryungensis]MBE9666166.1 glycerol-3-phosphate transporter [Mucilaginibacter boryungensis]